MPNKMPNKKNAGGRKRGENPLGLPANVHFKHGALYFVRLATTAQGSKKRVWLHLGRDLEEALLKAEVVRQTLGEKT